MTTQSASRWLVSCQWLAERLGSPDVAVVDGSFYLPAMKRDAAAEFLAGHIPGAVRFDIDAIADKSSLLPHMLPSKEFFADSVGALGISERDTIVVYDGAGLFSAPRVWWTFRLFGAANVFILDGGLPRWKAESRPLQAGAVTLKRKTFVASDPPKVVAAAADVRSALDNKTAQVVDVRAADRFRGEAPEPRPGVRPGHMPGALNVPITAMTENGSLASPDTIRAALKAGCVDLARPIITTCGSGVSAATLWLALDSLGIAPKALYDGSWTEWGSRTDLPVATGGQ